MMSVREQDADDSVRISEVTRLVNGWTRSTLDLELIQPWYVFSKFLECRVKHF